ncbi:uncharacterized protein LOC115425403 isoform X2 [Sphaeramia orbicularis]|uniref:uncharacterized protein LOC115425403 isoform X2 n=1 Tax=Sphaeramia orbicularis TaxID=375764 RepID=UPI00117DBA05|nr:uncharacterized protein LOC115425403 isoform X2 [Sphaeramia orbicularis]
MAQFNTKDDSLQDTSFQQEPGPKVSDVASIQGRIAALEESLSRAAIRGTDYPKPDLQKKWKGKVLSSPPEKQRYTDLSGSSVPAHLTNVEIKSEVHDSNHISRKMSVSHSLAKPVCPHISRLPLITASKTVPVLKPENQKPYVSSFLNVSQSSNMSLAEESSVTKQESYNESVVRLKTVSTKPSKLLETPKPSCITKPETPIQSQKITVPHIPTKKLLPRVNILGNPPLKPTRPATVNIQQFRTSLKDEPGEKMQHHSAPPPLVFPPSPQALTSQQLDKEETCDDVDMKLPPLPQKGYMLKEAESFQKYEESNSGKDYILHGEFMSELRGIFNRERKKIKAKNEQKTHLKQEKKRQKSKEKRGSKTKTKIRGSVYVPKKGRKLPYFNGGNRDSKSKKKETAHVKHNDLEMPQPLSDHEDSDDYEYIDAPAKLSSGLNMQNSWEDYDDVDIPDTSTSRQLAVDADTMNLPPLPHKGHLLKEAEVHSSKKYQKSISGKEYIHHGEFMAVLQGLIAKVEIEGQHKKVKKERKGQLQEKKQQKPKQKKDHKGKKLKWKKERHFDPNLGQRKIKITDTSGSAQISHSYLKVMPDPQSNYEDTGDYENIDAPANFYSDIDMETSLEDYDDVDIPDTSGLSVQTSWEGDVYDDVDIPDPQSQQLDESYDDVGIMTTPQLPFKAVEDDDYDDVGIPDTRVSPLPQLTADGGDIYDDVDSQSSSLPCAGLDIYEEVQVEESDDYDDVDIPNTSVSPLPQLTTDGGDIYKNIDLQSPSLL